jgi:hypothetical protein
MQHGLRHHTRDDPPAWHRLSDAEAARVKALEAANRKQWEEERRLRTEWQCARCVGAYGRFWSYGSLGMTVAQVVEEHVKQL